MSAARAVAAPTLNGLRKAAILMVVLGDHASGEVLRHLDEEEVQRIGREVARLTAVTAEVREEVLEEFYQLSLANEGVFKGGVDYARNLLTTAFGPDRGKIMLDRLLKSLGAEDASFDALQKADPQQLAKFIHNEHPQTIALILSHLPSRQAASLLSSLPASLRSDVAMRMAHLDQISPEIVSKIAGILAHKLKSLGEVSREAYGGVQAVAEICNRLDSDVSKDILAGIESADPALGGSIRHLMFTFEDLLRLDANAIKELLSRIDRKLLTVALKGTSDSLKDLFLSGMSQRGADMMREDMDSLGPVKIRDVEAAQQQVLALVRQLEVEGVVSMGGGASDQYVE